MSGELIVLLSDREIGRVRQDQRRRLKFIYNDEWRETGGAYPLSLSMPLAASEHPHNVIEAFIWGLLPENELVLERWAKKFQVSARSAFSLISQVGEYCAGAVQFVRPERLDAIFNAVPANIDWLDESDIATRLKMLRDDYSAWRRPVDTGQFSLAGAQPKTALLLQDGKWGVPSGRIPTTHILKPPTGAFDGNAENEHFCLALARALGMPAASSTVTHFGDEVAFVVERYDRRLIDGRIVRIHQEDICQAFGVPPFRKYENDGGPSVSRIVDFLRENSGAPTEDVQTFIDAVAYDWLVGGTDAHAKNYSILIGAGSRVRLAPLYDLASIHPYDEFGSLEHKLAMKLGGKYRLRDISARSWEKLSEELRLGKKEIARRVCEMAGKLPVEAQAVRKRLDESGMKHPVLDRLTDRLSAHAEKC